MKSLGALFQCSKNGDFSSRRVLKNINLHDGWYMRLGWSKGVETAVIQMQNLHVDDQRQICDMLESSKRLANCSI